MSDLAVNGKLEKICQEAYEKLDKINLDEYNDVKEKLAWCIGSYSYDKNPAGLYEIGTQALDALKTYKKEKPRLVSKKLIEDLEKVLSNSN
ncbi:hypothetical protein [Chondrinema litorale]|uniref:hypothetical protein n=1 Tax=Chondrinema litorale TaxID=2994555 RepID=UPI002542CFD9|nr:hypothetical protein [Chondrinema litorale]UZR93291.1 hypothetical protein OQ292_15650 [Chondrinema litorale]